VTYGVRMKPLCLFIQLHYLNHYTSNSCSYVTNGVDIIMLISGLCNTWNDSLWPWYCSFHILSTAFSQYYTCSINISHTRVWVESLNYYDFIMSPYLPLFLFSTPHLSIATQSNSVVKVELLFSGSFLRLFISHHTEYGNNDIAAIVEAGLQERDV